MNKKLLDEYDTLLDELDKVDGVKSDGIRSSLKRIKAALGVKSRKKINAIYTFVFVNDHNDTAFFSIDRHQHVSDKFIDLDFIKPHTKKWILNNVGATEIQNPDSKLQA
jgi:hypothetical protein